jgi:hypothetical protein
MCEDHIAAYLRKHLAELSAVSKVLDQLCQRDSSLELHRFFVRLQAEMGDDPQALKQLLSVLDEEKDLPTEALEEMTRKWLFRSGLDLKNPEIFQALEWLALEIHGLTLMWRTLNVVSPAVPAWREVDFKSRELKAKNQRDRIESVRLEVAVEILRGN